MSRKKSTSKDVAAMAGVSQATVSRVFSSNTVSISPNTREKVIRAADYLDYQPNEFARSLVMSNSNIIGIVKGYSTNMIFNEMLSEALYILQRANKRVIYFESEKGQSMDKLIDQIFRYQVEGLILLYTEISSALVARCIQQNIPVLQVHRYSSTLPANAVLPDNVTAATQAAQLFVKRGFKNFLYIGGDAESSSNAERQIAFTKEIQNCGNSNLYIYNGDFSYQSGQKAIQVLYNQLAFPLAILCANDIMAFGAMDALRYQFGRMIGKDVVIIGFDNVETSSWPAYSLSSFSQPIKQMVTEGIDVLFKNILNRNMLPVEKRYRLVLIERDTTKVLP